MARADFAFFHRLRVRYSEIDAQAVVFNARYLDYADLAITEYLRWLGLSVAPAIDAPEFHTARAVVDFRAPIRLDEEVDIGVRVARVGRTSMTVLLEIHGKDEEDLRAAVEEVYVNVDLATGRPIAVPARLIERLEAMAGAAAALS